MSGFVTRSDIGPGSYFLDFSVFSSRREPGVLKDVATWNRYVGRYDDVDREADVVWDAVEDYMDKRRRGKRFFGRLGLDCAACVDNAGFSSYKRGLQSIPELEWSYLRGRGFGKSNCGLSKRRRKEFRNGGLGMDLKISEKNCDRWFAGTLRFNERFQGGDLPVYTRTVVDENGRDSEVANGRCTDEEYLGFSRKVLLSYIRGCPLDEVGWMSLGYLEIMEGSDKVAKDVYREGLRRCPGSEGLWVDFSLSHNDKEGVVILFNCLSRLSSSVKARMRLAKSCRRARLRFLFLRDSLRSVRNSVLL